MGGLPQGFSEEKEMQGNQAVPTNANLRLILEGAIAAKGRKQKERGDLELDLMLRNGVWQGEAWGFSYDYNTADHYGTAGLLDRDTELKGEVRLTIGADPWVPGSAAKYELQLKRKGQTYEGTYRGVFGERPITGKVSGSLRSPYPSVPSPDFRPPTAGEHPRLIFRASDLERIRQRAETAWGNAILERLRERLQQEIVYTGDYGSNSAYFAAGQGFLYLLTGDMSALALAKAITEETMSKPPSRKGHQYAFSHPLLGLALAYDFCYSGWEPGFQEKVATYLEATSALVIAGRGNGFNHSPGSNWVARTRGGAGVALLAIRGDRGASAEVERLYKICERSAARYFTFGIGEHGSGAEGDGYHVESMEMLLPFLQASQTVRGTDLTTGDIGQGAAWTLPHYALRSFAQDNEPKIHRYGRHGDASRVTPSSLFCLGIASVPSVYRPAVRDFIDRFWGLAGDRTFGVESPHLAPYILALYPDTVEPADYRAVLPRAIEDKRKGFYIFRSGEFVATLYAKTDSSYGWNFPEAGTFRLFGFDTDWVVRAGYGPRDAENVVLIRAEDAEGKGQGRVLFYEAQPDGSGTVSLDLSTAHGQDILLRKNQGKDQNDIGIRSQRAFSVDYSGKSGAPVLIVLADKVTGGKEQIWLLHTKGNNVRQEGQAFVIEGNSGATLRATFIEPSPVRLQIRPNEKEVTTIEARSDAPKSAEFIVVLTIQQGTAPLVTGEGQGKNRVVRVGEQEIRLNLSAFNI
jgi:hypothetical protein